jgi:hypothetical protein
MWPGRRVGKILRHRAAEASIFSRAPLAWPLVELDPEVRLLPSVDDQGSADSGHLDATEHIALAITQMGGTG